MLDHVGLNHLTWERAAYVDGVDVLPRLLETAAAAEVELPAELVTALGCVPSYYLRYYYRTTPWSSTSGPGRPGASRSPRSRRNCFGRTPIRS